MKNIFSLNRLIKGGILLLVFSIIGVSFFPFSAKTAGGYTISLTSQQVGPFSITLSGVASGSPYIGNLDNQNVSVLDWGDGSSSIPVDSFVITSSGGSGSDKFFNASWSATHQYVTEGSYTITARVHHANINGKEGSEVATIVVPVVIPKATLTIIKHVVNNNGGTKTASDFTINVTGPDVTPSTFSGEESPGTIVSLDPGEEPQDYSVSEVAVSGYASSFVGTDENCSGKIASGESKICTITNTDNPDTTPPIIDGQDDITVEATSSLGAVVAYTPPNATDNVDSTAPATCLPVSGSIFPIGATVVTCNKTDTAGNTATPTSFNVIVQDTTKPIITLNGNYSINLQVGEIYNELGATAFDNIDGDISFNIVIAGDSVSTTVPAIFHISYDVSDNAGNSADQVVRTVTVSDINAPIINPIDNITAEATGPSGTIVTYEPITAIDNADGTLPADCNPISGSIFPLGSTDVACTATDSSNNVGNGVALTITVRDTTPPVIILNGDATINIIVGDAYSELGAIATDIVDGTGAVNIGGDTVTTASPATFHITYNTIDAAGNNATQVIRTVIVNAPTDTDRDGVNDDIDNCPLISNPDQTDTDNDGIGDVCDETPNGNGGGNENPNPDVNPKLTVTKVVINNNGGSRQVSDFALLVGTTAVVSGAQNEFSAGTYNVHESSSLGYTTAFSGDCDATGNITLNLNNIKSCTITNDDPAQGGGEGGGGGGGGGGPIIPTLIIIDGSIKLLSITENEMAISWETNLPSSSYVIYSKESEATPMDLTDNTGNPPKYGYTSVTNEIDLSPGVAYHVVTVTGLESNTTYYFRVVSRSSLAYGGEYKITTGGGVVLASSETSTPIEGIGSIASAINEITLNGAQETDNSSSSATEAESAQEGATEEESVISTEETNLSQPAALAEAGGISGLLDWIWSNWLWIIILLLLLAAGYYYYDQWNKKNKTK